MAITGLGAVTPAGQGVNSFWQSLVSGDHNFRPISSFDPAGHRTKIGAEIREMPLFKPQRLDETLLARTDIMGLVAAREALFQAGLMDSENGLVSVPARTGLFCATAAGGIIGLEDFFRHRYHNQKCDSAPLLTSFCLSALATNIAKEFGISGPRTTTATVCSSSGLALAAALEMLRAENDLDYMLVVASETLSEVTHGGFNSLRAIAPEICQPFDQDRQGLVLGEAAAAMVLARPSVVEEGRDVLAYFNGYGLTTDLHHFTAPQPKGEAIADTMQLALANAAVTADQIDYINAHGTGTPLNDAAEAQGIKSALGERSKHIPISSSKSMFGHTLGTASILEAVATVMAIQQGTAPPTANLKKTDPDLALDFVPNQARQLEISTAMSNSFAFGGSNISLVFSRSGQDKSQTAGDLAEMAPVITGIGVVSPLGVGIDSFRDGVAQGDSALKSLDSFGDEWSGYLGGVVDISLVKEAIPARRRRHLNRLGSFLTVAIEQALVDAGLTADDLAEDGVLTYGSAFGCSSNVHAFYTQLLSRGAAAASPQEFMLSVTNAPAALVAQHIGLKGPVWVFVEDEASWERSLHWAAFLIENGLAERVLVSAADEISDSILSIHQALGFMGPDAPGFSLGEGALVMVLESAASAADRGVRGYGRLLNYGTQQDVSCGPMDFTSSEQVMFDVVNRGLQSAGEDRSEDILLLGPANGLPAFDQVVARSMDKLNGVYPGLKIDHFRAMFGDSGLGGGFSLAAALVANSGSANIMNLTSSRGGTQAFSLVKRL